MTTPSTSRESPTSSSGRGSLWLGIAITLLGVAMYVAQFAAKILHVPWYAPVMATLGVLLLIRAVAHRRSVTRLIALALIMVLAAFEWCSLVWLVKLPEYAGPAQAGQPVPAFQTTLADGRPFTEQDLRAGEFRVIVFFRGRW